MMATLGRTKRMLALIVAILFILSISIKVHNGIGFRSALIDTALSSLQVNYIGISTSVASNSELLLAKVIDAAILPILTLLLATLFLDVIHNLAIREHITRSVVHSMEKHSIIAPYNDTSNAIAKALAADGVKSVIIARSKSEAASARAAGFYSITGDIKEVDSFIAAGIEKCFCVVACSSSDMHNAMIALTAKEADQGALIISIVNNSEDSDKILLAGATRIIHPEEISGVELAEAINRKI
jgi:voltage-gated potassium channel Kch